MWCKTHLKSQCKHMQIPITNIHKLWCTIDIDRLSCMHERQKSPNIERNLFQGTTPRTDELESCAGRCNTTRLLLPLEGIQSLRAICFMRAFDGFEANPFRMCSLFRCIFPSPFWPFFPYFPLLSFSISWFFSLFLSFSLDLRPKIQSKG